MKKPEQATISECEDGVDLMSNLPDHLLQLILSHLQGKKEAIRTSILSRRWRYLWTSIPSIDIDYNHYTRELGPVLVLELNGFKEFVYWVLLNKPQNLDSFCLLCGSFYNMLTIRQWIHAAVMRKVKLLDMMFCSREESEDIQVPHSLVTCGFQALRVLELKEVELFGDDVVKYFLESCPLLEDLSLIDCCAYDLVISCPKLKKLRIDTRKLLEDEEDAEDDLDLDLDWRMCDSLKISYPKLEFLKLTGYVAKEFLFENLYSLKKAVIHAEDLFLWEEPLYDLFARISHMESLSISLYCIGALFDSSVDAPISLPNLKTLELTVDGINMNELIPFLTCLPDLESLHLIIPKHIYLVHKWNLDEAATMSILTCHLKKVEFLEFDEEKPKLAVARALLEHGNALEEMVFSWGDEARLHERSMEAMNQVSKFHKASSTVKLRCNVVNPSQIDTRPAQNILDVELIPIKTNDSTE